MLGLVTHLCQWRSRQSSSGFGGIRTSPSRNTSGHWRLSVRSPSTSSERSHTWKWGGDRDTLLMLYRAIVRSKLDYGCIVYGTASNTDLRQLDSIMPYLAHHALHEFDPTIKDLYLPRPNGRGGMTRPSTQPNGLKLEETMTSAEIDVELVFPLRTPSFPRGTHEYDTKKHNLIEGRRKCMITMRRGWQAKFREYHDVQGPHDELYTDGSKINERVGAAAVVNRHFQNGETTCHQLSKRLPDNSTIFAAKATAITLALDYYRHMDPVQHDVVFCSDSMSCRRLRAKIQKTLSFVISWTSCGHWATKAHVFASAGCQAIVALRVMRWWTS